MTCNYEERSKRLTSVFRGLNNFEEQPFHKILLLGSFSIELNDRKRMIIDRVHDFIAHLEEMIDLKATFFQHVLQNYLNSMNAALHWETLGEKSVRRSRKDRTIKKEKSNPFRTASLLQQSESDSSRSSIDMEDLLKITNMLTIDKGSTKFKIGSISKKKGSSRMTRNKSL